MKVMYPWCNVLHCPCRALTRKTKLVPAIHYRAAIALGHCCTHRRKNQILKGYGEYGEHEW